LVLEYAHHLGGYEPLPYDDLACFFPLEQRNALWTYSEVSIGSSRIVKVAGLVLGPMRALGMPSNPNKKAEGDKRLRPGSFIGTTSF
jgi:hypothetical protein